METKLDEPILINGVDGKFLTVKDFLNANAHHARAFPDTPDDEIVVSGMSGRYPRCDNVEQFRHNLYNKIDMITDDEVRWNHDLSQEIPKRKGVINNLTKFDAQFFGIHGKQAHAMDPQGRQLIETAYEAILDAGIHPNTLRDTKTGVFVAVCFSETEKLVFFDTVRNDGWGLAGCSRAMMANRTSYCLGLTGPSFTVDTACSSSLFALDCAFSQMRSGQCDQALVCGTNLTLHPYTTINFMRLGVLSADGYCRPFDQNANGYTRSECICSIFLQKSKDAKRIYGKFLYSNTNCDGHKEEGILYPSGKMQEKLISAFYKELSMDPRTVDYVEAHGTGTVVGDPEECSTLDKVFCTGRKEPLLIGSVKSSIGHSEGSSGMSSITKVLLALDSGIVSPNINFTEIRKSIPALVEGRLKVCSEVTPLPGPLAAVNSFGFGGANGHALFGQFDKVKVNNGVPEDNVPRLVLWAGRTKEAVDKVLDKLETLPLDAELLALIYGTQKYETTANVIHGYTILAKDETDELNKVKCISKGVERFDTEKRPVVWLFTGMGSQWVGMGKSMMQIDLFHESIMKCHKALKPHGIDIVSVITSEDPTTFDHIINSFVGIAAIQVALVDLLRVLEVPADYFIGHSVGELGCAYADGTITAEQMVLAAYYRGLVSYGTKVIHGTMAAVGLSYEQIKDRLPEGVEVACHNSSNSATLSGPKQQVADFVSQLVAKGVFAKEVPCSNIPYHTKYIAEMGPKLLAKLKEIIPEPKMRSPKWVCTSVPKDEWEIEKNKYSSAEYHTNNLLSPVLFEEAATNLPENALTIEVAPHGLLQAIIKKALPNGVHISLTQRGNKDNTSYFLSALGKLFFNGIVMPVERLYPKVQFPVSRGTQMIAPLIEWDHSLDWQTFAFDSKKTQITSERLVFIKIQDDEWKYMTGHIIDGRCILPATSYLHMVRETIVLMTPGQNFNGFSVEFTNVKFLRATSISNTQIVLTVVIHIGNGDFEIVENTTPIMSGNVRVIKEDKVMDPSIWQNGQENTDEPIMLTSKEFYKELRLRGYNYANMFRSVMEAKSDGTHGKIKWLNNWPAFMDCLLQVNILALDARALYLPTSIRKIRIHPKQHAEELAKLDPENPVFDVYMSKELGTVVCGGVEICGMSVNSVGRRKPPGTEVHEVYEFVPYNCELIEYSEEEAILIMLQISQENMLKLKVKIVEVGDPNPEKKPIVSLFGEALENIPLVVGELIFLTNGKEEVGEIDQTTIEASELETQKDCHYIIATKALINEQFMEKIKNSLVENGYFIVRDDSKQSWNEAKILEGFNLITMIKTPEVTYLMYQPVRKEVEKQSIAVVSSDSEFAWLEPLREGVKNGVVVAVEQNESYSGILGLTNCIRREPGGQNLRCVQIDDTTAPLFDLKNEFYTEQMALDLAVNVLRNGVWGSYRHLTLKRDLEEVSRTGHYYANLIRLGDLSSFEWMTGWLNSVKSQNMVNIQYSTINFRDVMLATGRLPPEVHSTNRLLQQCLLGLEYSGVSINGDRLMGMVGIGAMATKAEYIPSLTWKVPPTMSLQDAATIPVVYTTVYYAFFFYRPISAGKSILIHAGSGGVGLAAIRVALAYHMEVYTTVSTPAKKKFIMDAFPQLKEENIGNSRDCSFEQMIMLRTKGNGVDYVLNSLAEDKLAASVRCLGRGGVFLEIGKFDIMNNSNLQMGTFAKEIQFRAVFADNLFYMPKERDVVNKMIEKDLKTGIIQPLHSTVFQINEVEKAFRFLSTGKHIGKVLVQIRESENSLESLPMRVYERVYFDANMVYIICGGLGGFGLELADWMVLRGARKIVFSSRSGIKATYQSYRIKIWESYGCKIYVNTADIATSEGCKALLTESSVHGEIGGIFNLAVLLQDSIFENQTTEKFKACFAPKANATRYLDELSRTLCTKLQHFVVFSSASCGRGNPGQTNYGMANSIMERIIEQRVRDKLPGKAIQWGAVGEVGLVAQMAEDKIDLEIAGTLQQRIASCLSAMDRLLMSGGPVVSSMVVAQKRIGSKLNLVESVMHIMGIKDLKTVSKTTSLAELGMDSLMAVEIKQTLEREFEVILGAQDLRNLTFGKLIEISQAGQKAVKGDGEDINPADAVKNMIFRSLGNEQTANEVILPLNSVDKESSEIIALFVPGIEGVINPSLIELGKRISVPFYALQLHTSYQEENLQTLAEAVSKDVLNLYNGKKYFLVMGHSFGSIVAFEVAKLLEKNGYAGRYIAIDGAIVQFKKFLSALRPGVEPTMDSIQDFLLAQFAFEILPEQKPEAIRNVMIEEKTWETRMDKFIGLMEKTEYSSGYLKQIGKGMQNRFKIILSSTEAYSGDKIKEDITLIRPTTNLVVNVEPNYELQNYTNGAVNLQTIDGNHLTMLDDPKLPEIINEVSEKTLKR